MPLFFFHLRSPAGYEWDDRGLEFPNVERAYLAAYRAISNVAPCLKQYGQDPLRCTFEITNEGGQRMMEVPFTEALEHAT